MELKGIKRFKPSKKGVVVSKRYRSKNPKAVELDLFENAAIEEAKYYYDLFITH